MYEFFRDRWRGEEERRRESKKSLTGRESLVFHDFFKSLSLEGSSAHKFTASRNELSNTNHLENIVLLTVPLTSVSIQSRKGRGGGKGIIHTPPVIVTA